MSSGMSLKMSLRTSHRVSLRMSLRKGRPHTVFSTAGDSTCSGPDPIQESKRHAPSHPEVKIELRLEHMAASLSILRWLAGKQVDEAAWREFQKLKEQLEQDKRDMAVLTAAFTEHRAQTAADSLVCLLLPAC